MIRGEGGAAVAGKERAEVGPAGFRTVVSEEGNDSSD